MRIVVIGTGYVGLVSGARFADFGHQVMRGTALIDLRNVYDRDEAQRAGLIHYGVARGQTGVIASDAG